MIHYQRLSLVSRRDAGVLTSNFFLVTFSAKSMTKSINSHFYLQTILMDEIVTQQVYYESFICILLLFFLCVGKISSILITSLQTSIYREFCINKTYQYKYSRSKEARLPKSILENDRKKNSVRYSDYIQSKKD